jgi:hypothetical protein
MSSTNRGYDRHKSDYYITPIREIEKFLPEFSSLEPYSLKGIWFDPCSGGDKDNPMSYPVSCEKILGKRLRTMDIRDDSLADIKGDYLATNILRLKFRPSVIITNPPFNLSRDIIEKSLQLVKDGGWVIMLLRLNYFGSDSRKDLWEKHMPKYCFVHSKRISFTPDGKTDSIEYAHFCWKKGYYPEFTQLKVI